jgi:hypothetical protein
MEYITTAALTILFTVLIVLFYKFVIDPKRVKDNGPMAICPDRWNYDATYKLCKPSYSTNCLPFDPSSSNMTSMTAKCDLARSCGTFWSGMCG